MKRVSFVVDGLNLYHSIERRPHWHGFKWLDLCKLANAFVKRSSEEVGEVCFCTSSPTWNLNKLNRHASLSRVYEDLGIKILKGDIRKTKVECRATCGLEFEAHEEKQTDINVAMEVVRLGMDANCQKVFLVSGDSDQVPTVQFFRETFRDKELVVVVPPGEHAEHLRSVAASSTQISLAQLKCSLIDDPYRCKSNGTEIPKPAPWFNKTIQPPTGTIS